jgi:mannan endo-1,4-beta-mannosidase
MALADKSRVSGWKQFERTAIINIANEWGTSSGTVWRDAYIVAVQRMRAAGYKHTLMIDAPDYGQNPPSITQYGADILAADPEHNIIFSDHIYHELGSDDYGAFDSPLCVCAGEFGPGRNIGPSPTTQTPDGVVTYCESKASGWLAWAFDDNNLDNASSDDNWFAFFYQNTTWNSDADLTIYGRTMIPLLQAKATKASIFE